MAKGRTAWEILTGQNKPVAEETKIPNPLNLKIGAHVSLRTIELDNTLFRLLAIMAWDRKINNRSFPMTDYILTSGKANEDAVCLRAVPREDAIKDLALTHRFLLLEHYYDAEYGEEVEAVLAACNAGDEFYINPDDPEAKETFWRMGGAVPIHAEVSVLKDLDGNGTVEEEEVEKVPMTYWDYHRTTKDEFEVECVEYLYVQLSGHYEGPGHIQGGDKCVNIVRGEEIDAKKVLAY